MKGTAEYETLLVGKYGEANNIPPGDATKGMDAQSAVHIFIVLAIIGNEPLFRQLCAATADGDRYVIISVVMLGF